MFTKGTRLLCQMHPILSSSSLRNTLQFNLHRSYSDTVKRRAMRVLTATEADQLNRTGRYRQQEHSHSYEEYAQDHENDILPQGMKFEKLNEIDKRLNPVIHAIRNRKVRERKNFVMLEGVRLIKDAMNAGAQVKYLYFTKLELLKDFPLEHDIKLFKLKPAHLKLWSDLVMPPGVVAICEKPSQDQLQLHQEEQLPVTLICDNIRDPGNIGSMLRIAASVGCAKMLATKGCVDVWDPKVVRAAAGSHFSLPVINNVEWQQIANYIPENSYVCLADSKTTTEHMNERLNVPFRQLWQTDFWQKKNIVLIMGGEAHGLSKAAYELANACGGDRIHIPITSRTESLNAAVASAVILFEIRKQMLQKLT